MAFVRIENINYVNFEEYVNRLSSSIRGSFSNQSTIKLETQINNSHFNIETAIPLGLIINELVINAFKHAFAGKDQGLIKIILFKEQDLHHLEITDNGIGIDTIDENGSSIGLKIVKLLVSQINGQMQIIKDSGKNHHTI
jgi:two-component sensor histidine kinase